MRNLVGQLDSWEACDEVNFRDVKRPLSQQKSNSPRFERRSTKNPQLSNGAHRRRNKRSWL
jgi:hypothetical protein